jgi:hypothetical protein
MSPLVVCSHRSTHLTDWAETPRDEGDGGDEVVEQ